MAVLLLFLVITAAGMGAGFLLHNEGKLTAVREGGMRAQYMAESGLAYAWQLLETYHVKENLAVEESIPVEGAGSFRLEISGIWNEEKTEMKGTIHVLGKDSISGIQRNTAARFTLDEEGKVVMDDVRSTRF